jgi:hypothetical protein
MNPLNGTAIRTFLILALLVAAPAFAQGGGTAASLSGTVVDSDGGVIPGATVEVKNNATGVTERFVTNASGAFSVPALNPGTYTVTVSLSGFKTHVVNDVRIVAATAAEVRVTLEIGALTETVEVRGNTDLVRTQATTVQSTMLAEQINKLPLISRNALSAVMFLPGVEQIGNYRNSTINGLPQNTINITLDGIGIGNNLQSGDGFYTQVFPRTDAVEEVTVTGATPDAGSGAQGSVQVAFATRSGSNSFNTSVYHYFRHPSLNTNYYFNKVNSLSKNDVIVHQYGGRIGGPIVPGKAFFFFNFEHFHLPNEATRTRTILQPQAMTGLFRYESQGQIVEVNVLDLAARSGHLASMDPTIATLLPAIRSAAELQGSILTTTDLNTQSYTFQPPSVRNEYAPTTRVDVNLTSRHRLTGTYLWQRIKTTPDFLNSGEPAFPGFPNYTWQFSYRTTGSATLRSTLTSNLINEFKTGFQWSPVDFYSEKTVDAFQNEGGRSIQFGFGLSNPTIGNAPQLRNTPSINVENSLSWLRGNHSFRLGGSFTRITNQSENWNLVPTVTLGFNANNDPANSMFNGTNFPGAGTGTLNSARALYALLTGRVTQIGGTARLDAATGEYRYLGTLEQRLSQHEFGAFIQDSWRMTPGFTLNYGLRWEVMLPFRTRTETFSTSTLADLCGISGIGSGPDGRQCNLFKPGTLDGQGVVPQYTKFDNANPGLNTEWPNFAPNIGAAWQPRVESGWLRPILGDPETATIRGAYSVSFNRERMDRFTGIYGNNPGGTTGANRNVNNGNLVYAGEGWPVLLRDESRLGPPATCPDGVVSAACVPRAPAYPIIATVSNSLSIFDPELHLPTTRSWTIGFQRSLTRDSAIEVRYVGNRNMDAWVTENWNERNIIENGFLAEFQAAQANLLANMAAGRGANFRYYGANTGTSPLPTYLAYFAGINPDRAGDPSAYTNVAAFANTSWTGHLGLYEPDPRDAANDLHNDATLRGNAIRAGLAPNFFVMNPAIGNANILRAAGGSKYHSLQLEYRRRLSQGLLVNASYTFARRIATSLVTIHEPRFFVEDDGVPHAIRLNWTYELPIGRGRRFGSDMNRVVDLVAGGWELSGTSRMQVQNFRADGVRLVGMSKDELQKEFKVRITRNAIGNVVVLMMPEDIILNTRRAFSTDPTSATGFSSLGVPEGRYIAPASHDGCIALYPGDCGTPRQILINGPWFVRFDIRATKRVPIKGRMTGEISVEFMNLFDNINFNPNFNPGGGANIFQVTSAYRDTGVDVNDPGGRIGQIVWRVTW